MWKRVVGPTLLVSLLWIAVGVGTTFYINWVYETHERDLTEILTAIQAAAGMQDAVWRIQAVVLEGAATGRSGPRIEIAELDAVFRDNLQRAERGSFTPEEEAMIETIRDRFSRYRDHVDRWLTPSKSTLSAMPDSVDETLSLAEAVAQPCKQFLRVNERQLAESNTRSVQLAFSMRVIRLSFLVFGPLLGILVGVLVARGLHRSVSQISVTLKDATGQMEHELEQVELSPTGDLPKLQHQVEIVSTQIRRVVDQLHEARREAIRAERLAAVGGLAAGVAHEIRNPLTSIKLLIQMAAQRHPERPLSGKQLQVIQQEIGRMEHTVQSLLDFARPPALNPLRHDLRETLQRALNLTEGRAKQEGVDIANQWPDQPVLVDGDPEQLHQVFVNLLINGIEAMSEGGVLQVAICAENQQHCRVVFSDSGSGVPQPVMERLFEPFVTSKEHGTGLGLAVSRRIIQEHGGTLSAANKTPQGATFTVELPLSQAESPPPAGSGGPPSSGDVAASLGVNSTSPDPAHADTPGH